MNITNGKRTVEGLQPGRIAYQVMAFASETKVRRLKITEAPQQFKLPITGGMSCVFKALVDVAPSVQSIVGETQEQSFSLKDNNLPEANAYNNHRIFLSRSAANRYAKRCRTAKIDANIGARMYSFERPMETFSPPGEPPNIAHSAHAQPPL